MFTLFFDGSYRGNENRTGSGYPINIMCYGWVIYEDGKMIARGHGIYTHRDAASSNGAEYLALIEGLGALQDLRLGRKPVLICGDAKTVIEQLQGASHVTSPRIVNLYQQARKLTKGMGNLHWQWIPRNKNHAADQLTRHALRQLNAGKTHIERVSHQFAGFKLIYGLMVSQKSRNWAAGGHLH